MIDFVIFEVHLSEQGPLVHLVVEVGVAEAVVEDGEVALLVHIGMYSHI